MLACSLLYTDPYNVTERISKMINKVTRIKVGIVASALISVSASTIWFAYSTNNTTERPSDTVNGEVKSRSGQPDDQKSGTSTPTLRSESMASATTKAAPQSRPTCLEVIETQNISPKTDTAALFLPNHKSNDALRKRQTHIEAKKAFVKELQDLADREASAAAEIARAQGWDVAGGEANKRYELMSFQHGQPMIYAQNNVAAAITTGAHAARMRYPVTGAGYLTAVWDAGIPRMTHREFADRVSIGDNTTYVSSHMTRIVGTMIAAGINPDALGMAPGAEAKAYGWSRDVSEMAQIGMSYPGEPDTIQISNHSYDYSAGWAFESFPPRWVGTLGNGESEHFGSYDHNAARWDNMCYETPYYLPFKAASNDRGDNAPVAGVPWTHWNGSAWITKPYDPATDPGNDNSHGGYDTLPVLATAKNPMVVGAVKDALAADGSRDLSMASMTSFSSWGPTDDGRIKPDIVANGWKVYSTSVNGDDIYSKINGTSIAVATASGSALLIVDHYDNVFPGEYLRASMLKGLIIHTADDMGPAGPDYKYGWGMINTEAALDHITAAQATPSAPTMIEGSIVTSATRYHHFNNDGAPIKLTVSWTDPAAASSNFLLDDRSSKLVHDLDVVLVSPSGVRTQAFKLDPENPGALATRGDNDVDNLEQISIASPTEPGLYTVEITVDGALSADEQVYSLLISGSMHTEVQQRPAQTVSLALDSFSTSLGSVTGSAREDLAVGRPVSLTAIATEVNGVRYVPQGWTGTGDLTSGEANTLAFDLTQDSTITFQYQAQTSLEQTSSPAGIIQDLNWQPQSGTASTVTAADRVEHAGSTYAFAYWTLDGVRVADADGRAQNRIEAIFLGTSHTAEAMYVLVDADADGDNKADWWELQYFGDLTHNLDLDTDGDGYSDAAEYVTQTDPLDRGDRFYFYVKNILIVEPPLLGWTCKEGCTYTIFKKASVMEDHWVQVENPGIQVDSENNAEWSDDAAWNADSGEVCIYKIEVSRSAQATH
ncbi:MAG: hypothetical protein ACI9QL_004010 [Candidatus Omnitrophota bacterium]